MTEEESAPVLDARGKAHALYEARRTRKPISPFTDDEPHLTMADGYAIEAELVPMLLADGDEIVGYKVGLTSLAMQRLSVCNPRTSVRYSRRLGTLMAVTCRWIASSRRRWKPRSPT
ncbi:hypothetical protein [Pseudonocardia xishanensis]|uniref:Uncharacterized protein n=1 Tax=Pseudonocardia xishanensis TaxID=630995 RepID=A0ABP8RYY8_9PSEU